MNDDMFANDISNRVLYDMIDRRFTNLESRMDRLEVKVDKLEEKLAENTERINALYLRGDKQQITFSRTLLAGNAFLAAAVAFVVAIFTGQFVIKNY